MGWGMGLALIYRSTRLCAQKGGIGFSQPPCAGQQKEKSAGVRARIVVKLGPPGSSRRCSGSGGAGRIHGKVNFPLLFLPALHPRCLHRCHFIPVVFSVGSWLGCWCSCRAPGPEPAPARWRGALRRAALHSLSRLPLFNQIIGKVNLLDSRSPLAPPSPQPTRSSLCPQHRQHPEDQGLEFSFLRKGQRAAASVCQDLPFPLSHFFCLYFMSSL